MVGPVSLIQNPEVHQSFQSPNLLTQYQKTTRVFGGNRDLIKLVQQAYYGPQTIGAQSIWVGKQEWFTIPPSAIATAGVAVC